MKSTINISRIKGYILTVCVLASCAVLKAQEPDIVYFLRDVPQSNRLNPAITPSYTGYLGGVVVPFVGQILPPVNIIYQNNSFAVSDLVFKNNDPKKYGDSLVTVFHDDAKGKAFANSLKPIVRMDIFFNLDLLNFGYKIGDNMMFNFSIMEKVETGVSFPRDIIRLSLYGNHPKSFPDPVVDLSGFGASATHYREYAAGGIYTVSEILSLGAKVKALSGMSNLNMKKTDIKWLTDADTKAFKFNADFDIYASQPFYKIDTLVWDKGKKELKMVDSMMTEGFKTKDYVNYALNFDNPGFAFDFGVFYTPIEKVNIYASVTDFGFIKWKKNTMNLKAYDKDGKGIVFEGIDVRQVFDNGEGYLSSYLDTLISKAELELKNDVTYKTQTAMKLYAGAEYKIYDFLGVGFLYKGIQWHEEFLSTFTFSANVNKDGLGAVVSYSISKEYKNSLGAGIALRFGPWQTYIMTDNAMSFIKPQDAQKITLRFGTNWLFGYKKREAALMPPGM